MERTFRALDAGCKMTGLALFLTAFGVSVYGWSITGVIKSSADGSPLPGVSVTVKDSLKYSTITDNNGNFKLGSAVAILDSRQNGDAGSYSLRTARGRLIVSSLRDKSLKLSLVDCSGRTVWNADVVVDQGVGKVALPPNLGRGAVFLIIRRANGAEFKAVGSGMDCGLSVVTRRRVASAAVGTADPTILFKKTDYRDTSFAMTSATMSNVMIAMKPLSTQNCPLPSTLHWQSSGILVNIHPDTKHPIASVKDPTIQKYNGKYLIYCTVYNTKSVSGSSQGWSMQFIQFSDFSQADAATPLFMDQISGFSGYKCAPELFYFEPKKIWYLTWQQQDPAYSTTTTPDNPSSWSAPKKFYPNGLSSIKLPIDYFPIADDDNFYLFFTGDDGNVYRAKTTLANFPNGFGTPVIIKTLATSIIFEGSSHYKIKGTANTYLHLVEGMGSTGRVYSAWTSEGIEGDWKDYKVGSNTPFAGRNNVTYASGVSDWSDDVSHGELLRDNPDQKQEVDPCHFQLLYQGKDPKSSGDYSLLPYRLGLLTAQ
jgi:hypothetical protein